MYPCLWHILHNIEWEYFDTRTQYTVGTTWSFEDSCDGCRLGLHDMRKNMRYAIRNLMFCLFIWNPFVCWWWIWDLMWSECECPVDWSISAWDVVDLTWLQMCNVSLYCLCRTILLPLIVNWVNSHSPTLKTTHWQYIYNISLEYTCSSHRKWSHFKPQHFKQQLHACFGICLLQYPLLKQCNTQVNQLFLGSAADVYALSQCRGYKHWPITNQ